MKVITPRGKNAMLLNVRVVNYALEFFYLYLAIRLLFNYFSYDLRMFRYKERELKIIIFYKKLEQIHFVIDSF